MIINETGSSSRTSAKDAVAEATPPKRRRKAKAKTEDRSATGSITPRKARLQILNDAEGGTALLVAQSILTVTVRIVNFFGHVQIALGGRDIG